MTKDVIVSVSGLQFDVNDVENEEGQLIEVLNNGTYYLKDGKHYVFFEEVSEGIAEVTKTQIRMKGTEHVEVIKKGVSNTHMIFDKGQKNRSYYETPFGQLNLGLFTKEILFKECEDNINVEVEYALDVNYEPIAECRITIDIKPRNSEKFEI